MIDLTHTIGTMNQTGWKHFYSCPFDLEDRKLLFDLHITREGAVVLDAQEEQAEQTRRVFAGQFETLEDALDHLSTHPELQVLHWEVSNDLLRDRARIK